MQKTNINWADMVWNPITGCTKVNQGCKFCYAEGIANRFWKDRKFTDVQFHPERLNDKKLNSKKSVRIFVNSMSDLFHESLSFEIIEQIYDVIFDQLINYPQHTFLILTKRIQRAREFYEWMHMENRNTGWENIWLGYSASTQKDLEIGINDLFRINAKVRWLSLEPLLEPIDLFKADCLNRGFSCEKIAWVVVGCESGSKRRECKNRWIDEIKTDCSDANVPLWIKQIQDEKNNVIEDVNLFPKELQKRELPIKFVKI